MKRNVLFLGAALLGGIGSAAFGGVWTTSPEVASRAIVAAAPSSELQLLLLLNGTPTKVGTLVATGGASINNSTTATPFTIELDGVYMSQCDGAANVNPAGGTASATITSANYGPRVAATDPPFTWRATSTAISEIPTSGAVSCAIWRLR